MGCHFILSSLFLALFISSASGAFPSKTPGGPPKNCHISTTDTLKTGEIRKDQVHFRVKNKAACEKMRRILSDRFDAGLTVSRKAEMMWEGNRR